MFFVKEAPDLRWVRWNKAGAETIGLSREELIGKTDYDVFPQEEADFFTRKDREALTSGRLVDTPEEPVHTRHKGVRILHTLKVPILDARGNPQYLVGLSEDITERKRAEEEASRTRAFLDSVVENIPLMVFVKEAQRSEMGALESGRRRDRGLFPRGDDRQERSRLLHKGGSRLLPRQGPRGVVSRQPGGHPGRAHSHPAQGDQAAAHAQGADPRCGWSAAVPDGHLGRHHGTQAC